MKATHGTVSLLFFILSAMATCNAQAADCVSQDLPNCSEVNSNLYRGGKPTAQGLKQLAAMNIKTIINLQGGDLDSAYSPIVRMTERGELAKSIALESKRAKKLGMDYINYPIDSLDEVDEEQDLLIQKVMADFANLKLQPIYVHCQHGKDRTGLVVALERIQTEKWSVEDARAEWIIFGHSFISRVFTRSLDRYFFAHVLAEDDKTL